MRRTQTATEARLWARLRARQLRGTKFRRQYPIGPFVADFCCPEYRLVIELDGGQHSAHAATDQARSAFLAEQGYRVLRFWNDQVSNDIEAVLEEIQNALKDASTSAFPSKSKNPSP